MLKNPMKVVASAVIAAAIIGSACLGLDCQYVWAEEPDGAGLIQGEAVEPERDEASGAFANSFRYVDGIPLAALDEASGISTLSERASGNTWTKSGSTYTCSDGTVVSGATGMGIDVSQWQGKIDWAKVKASGLIDYAIIRCGWGSDYSSQDDSYFIQNVRGCLDNGIPFGVYIYSYAYNSDMAQSEANHVIRMLKTAGLSPDLVEYPVYLDLENEAGTGGPCGEDNGQKVPISNNGLADIANVFCSAIQQAGYRPGIYANLNWWNNYLTSPVFSQWTKWVAQYNTTCDYGGEYDMWQCMSDGSIPGVNGYVDVNFDFSGMRVPSSGNAATDTQKGVPMYRLYNPYTSEHFYTASAFERNHLVSVGWTYENIAWYAPESSNIPVYRLYNPYTGDHHYTTSAYERDSLVRVGWIYENIGWYSDPNEGVGLYRLYNPYAAIGSHHYTQSAYERDSLVKLGWIYENVSWYGLA